MSLDRYMDDKDFHRYLDGEMTSEERKRFESDVLSASEPRELLRLFQTIRRESHAAVENEMRQNPTNYLWNSVRDRLETAPVKSWFFRKFALRAGLSLALTCALAVTGYHLLSRAAMLTPNNECMIEYIDNRTQTVTIFRGAEDGLTYIWITENPDRALESRRLPEGQKHFLIKST